MFVMEGLCLWSSSAGCPALLPTLLTSPDLEADAHAHNHYYSNADAVIAAAPTAGFQRCFRFHIMLLIVCFGFCQEFLRCVGLFG